MMKYIFSNIGLKIFSLFTATLLWFHVITEKTYEKNTTIPVTYSNLQKDFSLVKPPPKEVKVTFAGTGKELFWLDKRLKVILDLNSKGIGWHRIDLKDKDINIPDGAKLAVKEGPIPSSFIIRIDKEVEKQVRIIPDLKSPYSSELEPPVVRITGGSGDIYPVSAVLTEPITPRENFPETLNVPLILPDGIKSDVNSVTVIIKSKL